MAARDHVRHEPLLIVLAASAGAVDAISFLTFGVFTANMTGNVVLLGVAVSTEAGAQAARAAVSLLGFAVGALAAARISGRPPQRPSWPARATAVLGGTLVLQLAFLCGWLIADGAPTGSGRDLLVVVSALAMGAQSAAVASLGLPNVATTYITGTLTGLLASVATGGRAIVDLLRVGVIVGLACGATTGALLVTHAREPAPLLPVALTAVVIVLLTRRRRGRVAAEGG